MRDDIRWFGFWQELPWVFTILIGWIVVFLASTSLMFALPQKLPEWVPWGLGSMPPLAYGAFLLWAWRRFRVRRADSLQVVAGQLGMAFVAGSESDDALPRHDLPIMKERRGRPANLLRGEWNGEKVCVFDLLTGRSRSANWQTVCYFPDQLPGLVDFPVGFGWPLSRRVPERYADILRQHGHLSVEARSGRLVVYRRHHLVRPESYERFLTVAGQIHADLATMPAEAPEGREA